jgi:hypothetical protein
LAAFLRLSLRRCRGCPGDRLPTKKGCPLENTAHGRPALVDRAKPGDGIEGDAHAIAALVHAANPLMLDDILLRHIVDARQKLYHEAATASAAGAGGKIV